MALTDDSVLGSFYKPMQIFQIPYLFASSPVAWEFMKSPFVRELTDDMRKNTGIRTLVLSENALGAHEFAHHHIRAILFAELAECRVRHPGHWREVKREAILKPRKHPAAVAHKCAMAKMCFTGSLAASDALSFSPASNAAAPV